jgi:hypothetical protein
MRQIQAYHQRPKAQGGRGWSDIAYNFVIDGDDGVIYEGRGAGIRGGHVLGDENEHHGICLMGNYENETLTVAAGRSLVELLRHGHDRGWWQLNVRGHRQSPTASTACPGGHLFAALPSIRLAAISNTPPQPQEDLVLDNEDKKWINQQLASVLSWLTTGQGNGIVTTAAGSPWHWTDDPGTVTLNEVLAAVKAQQPVDVDEAAIVAGLAPTLTSALIAAVPGIEDLATADDLEERLREVLVDTFGAAAAGAVD